MIMVKITKPMSEKRPPLCGKRVLIIHIARVK